MTDKPTLTDAEIDIMVAAYLGDCGPQATRVYSFARAVLAKWGQPAQAAESRTIPDREIAGIVERALQELEGLVKYVTSTYCHWDMRRAKGALSDLEWWARRNLAAHAQAAEPVAWLRNTTDPQPHAVTNLKYRSAVDAKAGVEHMEALECSGEPDDPGHRCSHCDEYVDRNSVLRKAARARLEGKP